jgi:hypothetical protein
MHELTQKNTDFASINNRSYKLAAAVFVVSNVIGQNEELKTRIKSLSLELVSLSVGLKDIDYPNTIKLVKNLEKNSLELMSMLDIASVSGMISKMNGNILKEEFLSFISELDKFSEKFESNKDVSVGCVFAESLVANTADHPEKIDAGYGDKFNGSYKNNQKIISKNGEEITNGHKRKDLRKNTVLEFIKGHNLASIKDIVPNVNGCSEKTVQRELVDLINEGKIKKVGERRWSKYSVA